MKQSFIYRAHEWLADNCKWVQYPKVSGYSRPLFRHQMHWTKRVFLALFGVSVLVLAMILAAPLIVLTWALFTA